MPNPWFKMSMEDRLIKVVQLLNSTPKIYYTPRRVCEFYLKDITTSDVNSTRSILCQLYNLGFVDKKPVERVGSNIPVFAYQLINQIPLRKGVNNESKDN